MATNLTFSGIQSTFPRLLFKRADRDVMAGRAENPALEWSTIYSSYVLPKATSLSNGDYQDIVDDTYSSYLSMVCMGLVQQVEGYNGRTDSGGTSLYEKCGAMMRSVGLAVAQISPTGGEGVRRNRLLTCALAWDFCHDDTIAGVALLSDANKKTLGDGILAWCDDMAATSTELMDGHAGGDQACQVFGALAIYGESGSGYDYSSSATTRLTEGLDFWYGGDAGVTYNGYAAMDAFRYYQAGGGGWGGAHYMQLRWWKAFICVHPVATALTGIQLNGEDYDPWSEDWIKNAYKWARNIAVRGDLDFLQLEDTNRISNPVFNHEHRMGLGHMISHGEDTTAKSVARWVWERRYAHEQAAGQISGERLALDMILWERGPSTPTANMPADSPTAEWLDPPGALFYRSSWTLGASEELLIHVPQYWYLGHAHNKCGSIQMGYYKDQILINSGVYDTTPDGDPSDYGGSHNRSWANQTISGNGVVLVDDGSATPHSNYDEDGIYTAFPSGLGGQYWKLYGAEKDPENTFNMKNDASSEAWRRCEGTSDTSKAGTILNAATYQTDSVVVLASSLRKAYLKEYDDIDTAAERVRRYDAKWMIIKNFGGFGTAIFCVHRVESRLSTMDKRVPFHFHTMRSVVVNASKRRVEINGESMNKSGHTWAPGARVDFYDETKWDVDVVGGGTSNPGVPGDFDFAYGGVNYVPTQPVHERRQPDMGRVTAYVKPKNQAAEDYFVFVIFPFHDGIHLGQPHLEYEYNWVNETNYYGIEIGGKAYKLHKTNAEYISEDDPVDVDAPAAPTGLTPSTPASQTVQLVWSPNTEPDMDKYKVYYREKV